MAMLERIESVLLFELQSFLELLEQLLRVSKSKGRILSQDVTPSEQIEADPKVDRDITIFGYLRGTNMKLAAEVHIAGVGDYRVSAALKTCVPDY